MFPTHPDTVCVIAALDYQERLRNSDQARLAASAQVREGSAVSQPAAARRFVDSWCGALRLRMPWAIKRVSAPLTSG